MSHLINIYTMNVTAKHNLDIKNSTDPYTIDIYFQNSTGIHEFSVPFNWSTKTLDFGIFTYFMIVLIGVIVSKYVSKIENNKKGLNLEDKDYALIAISSIIALLIFSSFQQQVNLTTHIITNISLAFGFGFAFDKVLETGQRIRGDRLGS